MEEISFKKKDEQPKKKKTIQFKQDEIKQSIQVLFNVNNFIPFLKNFSIREIIKNSFNEIKEMKNIVCVLVNTKKILLADCEWNFNEKNKSSEVFKDKLTCSYIEHYIKILKTVSSKNKNEFNVYTFNKGSDLKALEFNDMKKNMITQCFTGNSGTCDILKALSSLFNKYHEANYPYDESENSTEKFIRVILFTGANSYPIEKEQFTSTLLSFENNSSFRSIVLNFLFMENDFFFDINTKNVDDIKGFIDFKENKTCLLKSTQKINYLMNIYNTFESECLRMSQDIYNYGKKILCVCDKQNTKHTDPLKDLLCEFITESEKAVRCLTDLQENVMKLYNKLKKPDTSPSEKENLKIKIENIIKENSVGKSLKIIRDFCNKFLETKNLKSLIMMQRSNLQAFYKSIDRFDNEINSEGLACKYWTEKVKFLRTQVREIESVYDKILNFEDLFEFLCENLEEYIKKLNLQ